MGKTKTVFINDKIIDDSVIEEVKKEEDSLVAKLNAELGIEETKSVPENVIASPEGAKQPYSLLWWSRRILFCGYNPFTVVHCLTYGAYQHSGHKPCLRRSASF